ncbi:MAG: Coenzyme F420 hydrogenase/dehydrogenase, beta subunit C-terminal domain [Roseivivax sp.]|nr:Coenzyme F420 hydrogenase/dehydrogenase, beta subunit C-terminal domain [Roseivivax sp.]
MAAAYTSPSLARVARGDLCAGCGACAGIAPGKVAMTVAAPGFLRPSQLARLNAEEEAAIAAACPGLGQRVAPEGRSDDVLWGPYVWMKTGHATDPDLRFAGSSGGALSRMLIHLVETGVVDAAVTNGADPDLPIGNVTVIAADPAEVAASAGSRYAPSAPLARLAELKADGRRFAFVGKPCDVAALRALIARDPSLNTVFPVLLSFFCAGVPSHAGGRAVLAALGTTLEDTAAFRFRGNGWPGRATARDRAGEERSMSYHDSWGQILSRHVQHRCKICADGSGLAADIVCADAWEADEAGYPLFDEGAGTSLIVARTAHGAALLADAETAGAIATQPFDVATLAAIQPGQRERRRALLARLAARRLAGLPIPRYTGLRLAAAARQNPLSRNVKNFLGMMRRSLRSRPRTE